ncbi:hypothetical protein BC628DRAFT_1418952 [Trametes gibbosa]|nr:hypothetical protein BC628DRAFT_1418952 [Trametes gibbosa]
MQQIILEEIDLEVAIRRRIADTAESRIAWALLLQESLQKSTGIRSDDFRTASLDAIDAIEAPCGLFFDRESHLHPLLFHAPAPVEPVPSVRIVEAPHPSTSSRSSRTRGPPRATAAPRERLLYIHNTATHPPEVAKLACHVCARSDFSSLQGLLNHCRLRHQIEYGSHDECMQSCAVLVPEEQRDWVVACGIEVGGVSLPSLRRLFELAVGAGDRMVIPPRQTSSAAPEGPKVVPQEAIPLAGAETQPDRPAKETAPQPRAHVTKTLGHHVDTPALAPFLGRAPKKRCINVRTDEDALVNIEDDLKTTSSREKQSWRKPYSHRNVAREDLDEVVLLSELPGDGAPAEQHAPANCERPEQSDSNGKSALQMLTGTRFHINARVNIADHSLFLQPNRRPAEHPNDTHRWRLTVTSPSYSLPIASVLRKLTVTCATDPPPASFVNSIVISKPPFVVTSTTDRPFLARLLFTWTGTMNPPTEVEHWVELDPMHHVNPALGDEQVFDVELDRSTELLPVPAGVQEPTLEDMHDAETATGDANEDEARDTEVEPGYSVKLRSLLPQFPMTLKDIKGRPSTQLPYPLANTRDQLLSMHYGRRKALEMARARALRDAYTQLIERTAEPGAIPLTTVDVFRWLDDHGYFSRASPTDVHSEVQKNVKSSRRQRGAGALERDAYCRTCGLHRAFHPNMGADEDTKPAQVHVDIKPAALGAALERGLCMTFVGEGAAPTRRPILDVDALVSYAPNDTARPVPYGLGRAIFVAPSRLQDQTVALDPSADFVAVADPKLVVAIQRLTGLPRPHNIPAAAATTEGDIPHSSLTRLTRADAAEQLSPSAILAVMLKPLVRHLIGRGVDALRQDEAALRGASGRHERARRATTVIAGAARRVLAPSHILRGVRTAGAWAGTSGDALRVCLARLGKRSALQGGGDERGESTPVQGERDGVGAIIAGPGGVVPETVVVKEEEDG